MKDLFNKCTEKLFASLKDGEILKVTFFGENSQFIRINNAKIRQSGYIEDADLTITLIQNNQTCCLFRMICDGVMMKKYCLMY